MSLDIKKYAQRSIFRNSPQGTKEITNFRRDQTTNFLILRTVLRLTNVVVFAVKNEITFTKGTLHLKNTHSESTFQKSLIFGSIIE